MLWTDLFTLVVVITYFGLDYFTRRKLSLFGLIVSIVLFILHYGLGWITGAVWTVVGLVANTALTLSLLSFLGYYIVLTLIGTGMLCFGIFFGEGDDPPETFRNGMPESLSRPRGVTGSNHYNTNKW